MVYQDILIFILSLASVVIGAELLVNGASKIAKHLGISNFVVGMTLVAIGTSLPELSIAIAAALKGEGIISIGNLIGASVTNLSLSLSIPLIFFTMRYQTSIFNKDNIFLLFITLMFFVFTLNKKISRYEGVVLLIAFLYYLYSLSKNTNLNEKLKSHRHKDMMEVEEVNLPKQILLTLIGIALLYSGARYLIPSTVNLANLFKIPEEIIALSIISIGTTLPELTVTIVAAIKKLPNLYLGNLVGSNITNLLLIVGLGSVIRETDISNLILYYSLPFLILITLLYINFSRTNFKRKYLAGFILLSFYIAYITTLVRVS